MNFHHDCYNNNNDNNNNKSKLLHSYFPSRYFVQTVPKANVYKAKLILFLPKLTLPALSSVSEMVLLHSGPH